MQLCIFYDGYETKAFLMSRPSVCDWLFLYLYLCLSGSRPMQAWELTESGLILYENRETHFVLFSLKSVPLCMFTHTWKGCVCVYWTCTDRVLHTRAHVCLWYTLFCSEVLDCRLFTIPRGWATADLFSYSNFTKWFLNYYSYTESQAFEHTLETSYITHPAPFALLTWIIPQIVWHNEEIYAIFIACGQ